MTAPMKPVAMRDALLERIWQEMNERKEIFFLSADFGSPVLDKIRADHPDRFINVGIAEQNLINVAAGLALEGYTVFAYAIAPFITMRCYEQIRVNLVLLSEVRRMNVNLIGVGAGYSYFMSGPTHQCYEDITLMRALPSMHVMSPADHVSAASLLERCINHDGPKYLRLDAQILPVIYPLHDLGLDKGFRILRSGNDSVIIGTGYMVHTALKAAETLGNAGLSVGVIDLFDLSYFDQDGLLAHIRQYATIVSMEEGFSSRGGMDSMLFDLISGADLPTKLLNIGVTGGYSFELGTREELHELAGIGSKVCLVKIRAALAVAQ